jgi:hypothetical protein
LTLVSEGKEGTCRILLNDKSSELESASFGVSSRPNARPGIPCYMLPGPSSLLSPFCLQRPLPCQIAGEDTYVTFEHPLSSSSSTTGPSRLSYRSISSSACNPSNTSSGIGEVISFCLRHSLFKLGSNRLNFSGISCADFRRRC